MCYINENMHPKTGNVEGVVKEWKIVSIKLSIKTRKWLFIGLYKPTLQNENNFLDNLYLITNRLSCQYENFMLIGDFNMNIDSKKPYYEFVWLRMLNQKSNLFSV